MKTIPADPLTDSRFQDVLRLLRAQPAPAVPAGFAARVVAQATGSDPLAADSPLAEVVRKLRTAPAAPVASPDFVPRTVATALAADRMARQQTRHRLFRLAEAAAVAAVLVMAGHLYLAPGPGSAHQGSRSNVPLGALLAQDETPRPQTPLQILLAAQRPDGAFASDEGSSGVTALAVLALLYNGIDDEASATAVAAGLDHLAAMLRDDGTFGGTENTAAYNAYLAAKALQAGARLPNAHPEWLTAARQALRHLPEPAQVAALNRSLAHPGTADAVWSAEAVPAALALFHR
ncbi:MAG: hypothetical protein ILO10_04205 [Kiritimatiellae bacterium]|nr:hypothetical protein [Kiritimatiellia bacterium]